MEERSSGDTFRYTYSAGEQTEIRKIREKYAPPADREDKLQRLRRLDASATRKGTIAALILGILGCLILGAGMSMIMVWGEVLFLPGILVGTVGLIAVGVAYPVYGRMVRKQRERLAPEILRLTDELMEK
ncbi:MAG: hypothetical protein E7459_04515 [Ruminococcaceae bacterium]|nr:hypothetical protein [Oscillospiraceae bacterium]